tara:strand:- start:314 stop:1114 length:801 start_codon:yes stop_codon:yes gene_type:complete
MNYKKTNTYKSFLKSKYYCLKHTNYFDIYDDLFEKYRNKKITFVEIGIFSGGSLFMWRNYFGKKARIIGIDLNPESKKFEKYGFEIFIGDQSKVSFWKNFFRKVGKVDIVLDDGGHTNFQQIVTTNECVPMIKDKGLMVIEDVHTSFIKKNWYNPSKYSFINYSKKIIEDINSRFPGIGNFNYSLNKYIYKIQFFESIVSFDINRKLCKKNDFIQNFKKTTNPKEYRNLIDSKSIFFKIKKYFKLKTNFTYPIFLINSFKLKKYFK